MKNVLSKSKEYYDKNSKNILERQRKYYHNNKDKRKNTQLKTNYGITLEEYNLMLEKQNYRCAICESETAGYKGTFSVDHCHNTGKVRGLLCNRCNLCIGSFNDDISILSKAIVYLTN